MADVKRLLTPSMSPRWRRLSAFYLATFFIAAAVAPHHHLNPIADLISDGPSNSGSFLQVSGPVDLGTGLYTGCLVDDESCLACFHRDFVASPTVAIALTPVFVSLPHDSALPGVAVPPLLAAETPSRAPPFGA